MTTKEAEYVWVAIATYAPEDDIPPLCAVGITFQEAAEQIDNVIHEHCKVSGVDPEMWIAHDPVERPVLPRSTPSGHADEPSGVDALHAAGIPNVIIQEWFDGVVDMIADDPKGQARQQLDNLTPAELIDDMMNNCADDEWEAIEDDPTILSTDRRARTAIIWYATLWRNEIDKEPDMDDGVKVELHRRLDLLAGWLKEYPLEPEDTVDEDDTDDDMDDGEEE